MLRIHQLAIVIALLTIGCKHPTPVVSPTAPACEGYCNVLAFYNCEESRPQRRDRTCLRRCQDIEKTGYLSIDPQCVVDRSDSLATIKRDCNVQCNEGAQP